MTKLTESEIDKLIQRTMSRVLKETDETRGSIIGDKEDVIREIVEYVEQWFNKVKNGSYYYDMGRVDFGREGDRGEGVYYAYKTQVPVEMARKLGYAREPQIDVQVENMIVDMDKYGHLINYEFMSPGGGTRVTDDLMRTYEEGGEVKFYKSHIFINLVALNGDLNVRSMYTTLYHELNHMLTSLRANDKFPGGGVSMYDLRRKDKQGRDPAQYTVHDNMMEPDHPIIRWGREMTYGEWYKQFRDINFIIYSIWEITERNARAEEMYGDLQYLKATRDTFWDLYPKTNLYHRIEAIEKMLNEIQEVPLDTNVWGYVAGILGEKSKGRARKRFLVRSWQLLKEMYDRAMRVAKYYFDKHEPLTNPGM